MFKINVIKLHRIRPYLCISFDDRPLLAFWFEFFIFYSLFAKYLTHFNMCSHPMNESKYTVTQKYFPYSYKGVKCAHATIIVSRFWWRLFILLRCKNDHCSDTLSDPSVISSENKLCQSFIWIHPSSKWILLVQYLWKVQKCSAIFQFRKVSFENKTEQGLIKGSM